MITLKCLMYEGPFKGKIRFLLKRKQVVELYKEMLEEVDLRYYEGEDLEEAVDEVNDLYERHELGMYLLINWKQHLIGFGFRDMQMKDFGYYELVG